MPGELFKPDAPTPLTGAEEELKRQIYERMNPRGRRFVDRIGYDQWDPFQAPKEPLDMRRERTGRTLQELLRDFMRENEGSRRDEDWRQGARECALGIFQKNGKFQGIYDFCVWYSDLLQKEGEDW